jgi:hypothetical protein
MQTQYSQTNQVCSYLRMMNKWLLWHHMVVIHEFNNNLFHDSLTTNMTIHW